MKLIYLFVAVAIGACSGSSNSARPCDQDSECNLGEVCSSGSCVPGCRSARDCPPEKAICDLTAGSDGACVECVAEADCGDGRTCVKGTCRKTCETNADCP